jgi:hypothetical protein
MERWAINIDMEGFSVLWKQEDNKILQSFRELMKAIFRIGCKCFPDSPERLFAHQIGDGFLIVSDFHEENLERSVTIAVALMKHVAANGHLTKAVIVEGDFSDIQGCYPKEVISSLVGDHTVSIGHGLMTIFPVMGTALIKSVKIATKSPKGPLLTLEKSKISRLPQEMPIKEIEKTGIISIDWINMETPLLKKIQSYSGLSTPSPNNLKNMLAKYCVEYELPAIWVKNARLSLDVPLDG